MAKNALTDEELLAQLEGIGATPAATKSTTRPSPSKQSAPKADQDSADPITLLENLAKQKPHSRPNTPKLSSAGPRRTAEVVHTPSSSARNSEDRIRVPRRSGESTTPLQQELTPTSEDEAREQEEQAQSQQSSWWGWGGIVATATATASAAVKQAEAAVKEIQKNEEALKWAEQVKGNVGALRGFGELLNTYRVKLESC
jgi:hypothetical protein